MVHEGNYSKFSNVAADRLIEAIAAARLTSDKRRLLRRFQTMMQQQAPLVPLFFLPYRLAANRRVQHLYPSGLKPGYNAATITWAAENIAGAPAQ